MSRQTLAEMVGTTGSRTSFLMNRFKPMGFIDYKGALAVHRGLFTFALEE